MKTRLWIYIRSFMALLLFGTQLLWSGGAAAVFPPAGTATQFDITGFLQEATVTTPGVALSGGTLKVNDHVVTVPANTIVILPANALTWEELFAQAPAPYTGVASGMALADLPAPMTTYEAHVVGNRVGDTYIAGLVYISQQGLNSGAGFINFIDYTNHEMRVGGVPNDPTTGARVRINDPTGKYGPVSTPDPRFTLDPDNPTIRSGTGFPMCLPRVAPPLVDPLCPTGNRLQDATGAFVDSFVMPDPATLIPGQLPDPRIQAPFEVGDYVTFSGTLVTDTVASPTVGPFPGTVSTYISAHTITANTAIFTAPGTNPAYVAIDTTLLGTGGLTVLGAAEATIRTRFEGMATDVTRLIHVYGIDVNPNGTTSDRDWGTIGVDPGPPSGAVKGRWRFRPPCLPFGTVPTKPDKQCVMNASGTFLPATREVRAVVEGQQSQGNPATALTAANGLFYGQYHAPILELIFPENIPGTLPVPNNFESIPFLACGGYTSAAGTLAAALTPWPGAVAPVCAGATTAPVASAGADQTVASGAPVTLTASATGNPAPTFTWIQTVGPAVVLSGTNPATFTAPTVAATTLLTFQVTATNSAGASTATTNVTVNAAAAPTVNAIAPITVASGTPVTLTGGADPTYTYQWTQTGGTPVVLVPNPTTGPTVSFTPILPVGTTTNAVLSFSVTATNAAGVISAPTTTTVTVTPPADSDLITLAEYRTGKQRLDIQASSSIISPNIVLKLQPYVTTSGTVFDPSVLGNTLTNNNNGTYILTLIGAPEPAIPPATPLQVKSSIGGSSPLTALTKIRN